MLAILATVALAQAQDQAQLPFPTEAEPEPGCPVGIIHCQKKPVTWEMCKKNDLLDVYVSGLPTEGDRSAAPRNVDALKMNRSDNSHYTLEGQAQISQLDLLLRGDKIIYDAETTDYNIEGHMTYQDRSMLMSADLAKGNVDLNQCTLDGVRYQLLSSRGNGIAEVAVIDDVGHARLTNATYSTCDVDRQSWAFSAREMELDEGEGIGNGKNVVLRVHDVPVFWFPWARWSLDDRRLSGFLTPMFNATTRRGLDVTFPYYFNLAPNYDATLYPRIMTERGEMLGGEFRYVTDSSKGMISFDGIDHDQGNLAKEDLDNNVLLPEKRWWYRIQDTTGFNSTWAGAIDINRVSDPMYFDDFGRGLYAAISSYLPSSAYLYGHGTWWNATIGGDSNQITDPSLTGPYEPYRRLPHATFNAEHAVLGDFTLGINSELTDFDRYQSLTGQRIDLFPYLAYPIETAAYFVRPQLGYRYTAYDLQGLQYALSSGDPGVTTNSHPTRGMPIFNLDAGLIFERSLNFHDQGWTQTLEPRIYYLYVPYRNQNDLPMFDTAEVPFAFGQMFRTNGFVGADRQMDANNLSLALTTRFLEDSTGTERVSASIGQIRYLTPQQLVQVPYVAPTYYSGSVYDGELDLHLNDRWRLVLEQQWNPNTHEIDLSTVSVENRFGNGGIVNFSYRYRRDFEDQIDVSAAVPLTPSWRLVARDNYAIADQLASPLNRHGTGPQSLDRFIGIEHEGCCTSSRLIVRRWVHDLQGNYDTALYLEVTLKGIGPVGQNTDAFLRHGILGYQ